MKRNEHIEEAFDVRYIVKHMQIFLASKFPEIKNKSVDKYDLQLKNEK